MSGLRSHSCLALPSPGAGRTPFRSSRERPLRVEVALSGSRTNQDANSVHSPQSRALHKYSSGYKCWTLEASRPPSASSSSPSPHPHSPTRTRAGILRTLDRPYSRPTTAWISSEEPSGAAPKDPLYEAGGRMGPGFPPTGPGVTSVPFLVVWPGREGCCPWPPAERGAAPQRLGPGRPTIMDQQVWPESSLLQDLAGGWGRGGHLALVDVEAQAAQLPDQASAGLLRLIGAEPHLQPRPLQSGGGNGGAVARQGVRPPGGTGWVLLQGQPAQSLSRPVPEVPRWP